MKDKYIHFLYELMGKEHRYVKLSLMTMLLSIFP
jgi:hypothetical protein